MPTVEGLLENSMGNVCSGKTQRLSLAQSRAARRKQECLGWDSSEPPKAPDAPSTSRGGAEGVKPRLPPQRDVARRLPPAPLPRVPRRPGWQPEPVPAAPRGLHLFLVPLERLEPRRPPCSSWSLTSAYPHLRAEKQPDTCAPLGLRARSRAAQARARPFPAAYSARVVSTPFPPAPFRPRSVRLPRHKPLGLAGSSPWAAPYLLQRPGRMRVSNLPDFESDQ